jgi:acyl-CoA reductase-like NAD-dependent aldehyde dehydrogenase
MLPPGVVNLVNGTHDIADRLMDHPLVKGISLWLHSGSSPCL